MRQEMNLELTPANHGWTLCHGSQEVWVFRDGLRGFWDRLRYAVGLDKQRHRVRQYVTVAFFAKDGDGSALVHAPTVYLNEDGA